MRRLVYDPDCTADALPLAARPTGKCDRSKVTVREAAFALAGRGRIVVTQKGELVEEGARGAIRLKLSRTVK